MGRRSKIDKAGLGEVVIDLKNKGKTFKEIALILKDKHNLKVSHTAVSNFLKNHESKVDKKAIEVIKQDERRVMKSVNYAYDIIESQLLVSNKVLCKLDGIDDIESLIKSTFEDALDYTEVIGVKLTPDQFYEGMAKRLSNNIRDYTMLTREVRENNKFLSDLKSKIYDFQLVQEFVNIFVQEFEKEDKVAARICLERVAANDRLRWLAEEQLRIRGE